MLVKYLFELTSYYVPLREALNLCSSVFVVKRKLFIPRRMC